MSSVNSSFSSNRAGNLNDKNTAVENVQIHLDFHNSSNNSGLKEDHHNDIDEDDDEEIITGHTQSHVAGSTATSESNSPHRGVNNCNNTDLNSSGDENDHDNSDDKILTL